MSELSFSVPGVSVASFPAELWIRQSSYDVTGFAYSHEYGLRCLLLALNHAYFHKIACCLPGLPPGLSTQWSAFFFVTAVHEDVLQANPRFCFHVVG